MAPAHDLFAEYQWRGMVHTATDELPEVLANEKLTAYIGFDPSAASLHVGSLLPAMALARLQRFGHTPIAIVGGGTGLIGDPSGKTQERQLLTKEQVERTSPASGRSSSPSWTSSAAGNPARIVDNADWLSTVSITDFLRDVGKYFTVNSMLAKESVKRRMGGLEAVAEGEGISFTEFSYMLLQAYDFLVLYDRYGCTLQMGGSDQWGNIVAGIDLIRRLRAPADADRGAQARSARRSRPASSSRWSPPRREPSSARPKPGTVWLDAQLTSPYRFYQFWLNTDDRDVVNYLKFFTWLERNEIEELAALTGEAPERARRNAVSPARSPAPSTGRAGSRAAERATRLLFGERLRRHRRGGDRGSVRRCALDRRRGGAARRRRAGGGRAGGGERPRRFQGRGAADGRGGGMYLNNRRLTLEKKTVTAADAIDGRFLVLRKGQKTYQLVGIGGEA